MLASLIQGFDRAEISRPGARAEAGLERGGRERLGTISKRGDRYLRRLFTARRAGRDPLRQGAWHQTPDLGSPHCWRAVNEGRRGGARQRDGKNGMGHDGQRRTLQGTRRTGGVNEIVPVSGTM